MRKLNVNILLSWREDNFNTIDRHGVCGPQAFLEFTKIAKINIFQIWLDQFWEDLSIFFRHSISCENPKYLTLFRKKIENFFWIFFDNEKHTYDMLTNACAIGSVTVVRFVCHHRFQMTVDMWFTLCLQIHFIKAGPHSPCRLMNHSKLQEILNCFFFKT